MLEKRILGRTGREVTVLGFGASELRGGRKWAPELPDEEAGKVLNAVLDGGINFIDTALDYGRSEELIGNYISHRRSEFFITSSVAASPVRRMTSPTSTPPPTSAPASSTVFAP